RTMSAVPQGHCEVEPHRGDAYPPRQTPHASPLQPQQRREKHNPPHFSSSSGASRRLAELSTCKIVVMAAASTSLTLASRPLCIQTTRALPLDVPPNV